MLEIFRSVKRQKVGENLYGHSDIDDIAIKKRLDPRNTAYEANFALQIILRDRN